MALLSEEPGPRQALCELLPVVGWYSSSARGAALPQCGQLVARLRADVEEAAGIAPSAEDADYFGSVRALLPHGLFASLAQRDWDELLDYIYDTRDELAEVSGLLVMCIQLRAPLRVFEYVVCEMSYDVDGECVLQDETLRPLLVAIKSKQADVALLLLENSANMDCQDEDGRTPLIMSCIHSSSDMHAVTRKLVDLGSDVDFVVGEYGRSALSQACFLPDGAGVEQARCLLDAGASRVRPVVNAIDIGKLPVLRLLLEHSADEAEFTGRFGSFVFQVGIFVSFREEDKREEMALEMLDLLVQNGMSTYSTDKDWLSFTSSKCYLPRLMQRCVELGAGVDRVLQSAVAYGTVDDVRWTLQMGGGPNSRCVGGGDKGGASLVSTAVRRTDLPPEEHRQMVRLLLLAGADADSEEDDTPALWAAVRKSNADLVQLLLQAGASRTGARASGGGGSSSLVDLALVLLPSVVPWLLDEKYDCGQFDPENKGLGFVFTHCSNCREQGNATDLHSCSGCVMVAYCSVECQRAHWKQKHKTTCKKKREMEEKRGRG